MRPPLRESRPGNRRRALAAAALVLAACAAQDDPLRPLSMPQLAAVIQQRVGPGGFDLPFALDEETRLFFEPRVSRVPRGRPRVDALLDAIFDERTGLGLTYQQDRTLSAVETFRARRGNCVSFVNLFIGAARAFDVPAFFVEVDDYSTFRKDRSFVVNSTHLVGGFKDGQTTMTVDFLPGERKRYRRYRAISDVRAVALYYNNKAVEELLAGRAEAARDQLQRVLLLEPRFARAWNNLGVCKGRLGDDAGALETFRRSVDEDAGYVAAHENLAAAYRKAGDLERSQAELTIAADLKSRNPFLLLAEAEEALHTNDLAEAERLYREAHRRDPSLSEPLVGLARVASGRGESREAARLLRRALALDPENTEARRLLEADRSE